MVYGTYNELVTGAFVNQQTSLGGLTLYSFSHAFPIFLASKPRFPPFGLKPGWTGGSEVSLTAFVNGWLVDTLGPTKVTIISGGLEIGWIDWRDGQMDNQYVLYIYVRI